MKRQLICSLWAIGALAGCSKEDPQALINQWNAAFFAQRSACDAGNIVSCEAACKMSREHQVCTKVSQTSDLNDPVQRAWVEKCMQDALEQGREPCASRHPLIPSQGTQPQGGSPVVTTPSITAPVIAYPKDDPIADLNGAAEAPSGEGNKDVKNPSIHSSDVITKGSLPKEVIRRIVHRHTNEVKFCYERELTNRPTLEGRISMKFIISGNGQVQMAAVAESTIGSKQLENCIADSVRRWTFPEPEGGGIVIVTYPFEFKSK
jgi:hypothetical protein